MPNPIKIAIIGCGQIGRQHIQTYGSIPDAEVLLFCDKDTAAAEAGRDLYGRGEFTTDYRTVLNRSDIEAVDVCLHNNFHAPMTNAALQAGKHVYCEKPMAGSFADAESMMATASETENKLHIQLATLYSDETRAAKELIDSGELGTIYHARSSGFRRRGRPYVDGYGTENFVKKSTASGGALYDMGVYHVSQVLYLMGNPRVSRISGKTFQKVAMDEGRRKSSGYDVEEMAVGFVRFGSDRSMELVESWAANLDDFGGSYLLGEQAGIKLNPFGFFKNSGNLELCSTASLGAARSRWNSLDPAGRYSGESQAHWIAALQGLCPLMATAEIALNTMLISEGIYLSERLGHEVTAEEVRRESKSSALSL